MTNVMISWKSFTIKRWTIINFLKIRKNDMMSSTTLMTSIDVIYLRLFKLIMRDENFLVINITIIQLLSHSIRKLISFMFHVFDNWMSYWFMTLFKRLKYYFKANIQSTFFLFTTIKRYRRFLRSRLRSRYLLIQWIFTRFAFELASRNTKLTIFLMSLNVNERFFSFMRMM